ncbi:MAG: helix-turn-helix domain-containing protein [Burkholderiaceae bacterium]|nr:helix-turn-helix domain-containing protein [Burkholderiaceae bacterium]
MAAARIPRRSEPVPRSIAVVAFHGVSPFQVSVPCLVFGSDLRELGVPRFHLRVVAAEPAPLRSAAGFAIDTPHGLGTLRHADVVIVPSWRPPYSDDPPVPLLRALRAAHARGATVVGLCTGAFLLAAAGLLDGRRATTHWHWSPAFAARYPAVNLDPSVLYVDDGRVVTSAGIAASLDCCLHLLRRWCGAEVANRVARRLVLAPHRRGGQAQFIQQPLPPPDADTRLHDLLQWLQARLHERHDLDTLARRVAMSRRSFTRHFQRATGTSVVQWLTHQRLMLAGRLLETTDRPVESIAVDAGFGSALSLRQHFAARFGMPPIAYRRQYRPAA